MASRIRVLIVDDHQLFAEVIRSTLERHDYEVVGAARDSHEGLELAQRLQPELALVDIGLPDESGLSLGRKILNHLPDARVVALTALNDAKAVAQAIRLGFHGYITKDTPVEKFVSSVQAVMSGHVVLPKQLAKGAAGGTTAEDRRLAVLVGQLTNRELEVLSLLAEGANSGEIARRLSVSPNTVRTHVQNILTKLQVHSRLEAAAFAVRNGLVRSARWSSS